MATLKVWMSSYTAVDPAERERSGSGNDFGHQRRQAVYDTNLNGGSTS